MDGSPSSQDKFNSRKSFPRLSGREGFARENVVRSTRENAYAFRAPQFDPGEDAFHRYQQV